MLSTAEYDTIVQAIRRQLVDVDLLWAEMDRLAEKTNAQWTVSPSAVDSVHEGR